MSLKHLPIRVLPAAWPNIPSNLNLQPTYNPSQISGKINYYWFVAGPLGNIACVVATPKRGDLSFQYPLQPLVSITCRALNQFNCGRFGAWRSLRIYGKLCRSRTVLSWLLAGGLDMIPHCTISLDTELRQFVRMLMSRWRCFLRDETRIDLCYEVSFYTIWHLQFDVFYTLIPR